MTNLFDNNIVITFPDITKIDFVSISKKYLNVILLNITIYFVIFICSLFIVTTYYLQDEMMGFKYYLYAGITILFGFFYVVYAIGFKKRKYAVREKDVSYKSGILFKQTTSVPFNRVQHIEIDQGPFSRFFKLASLSVYTAGDSSDDLKIKGILKEDAIKIKEFISTKIDG
ncbi:PH domain-containing protein [uncultured Polaribacter sp.]|uniref:PH domain-containing protein n=1 Tax=uncultured Polaribacter sp. TaxID=174711 RepID=UPI0026330A0C|nr:PH domain-containing protein [uncultured Polaribacter sp.]